jgi:stage II sporulation protein D
VTCRFCKPSPHYQWERHLTLKYIENALKNKGYSIGKIKRLAILERNSSGRVKKLKIVVGRGWGHGVGFCQWGAKGMSLRGYNYKRILNYYYPHTRLEKWSE